MIWFYYPAFVDSTLNTLREFSEVEIADLTALDDSEIDYDQPRHFVKLHDPDYVTEIKPPTRTILKRSMNDTIRTYVEYNRSNTNHYDFALRFDHLTSNRMKAIEHFLLSTEGKNIGYKSPRGNFGAVLVLNPDTLITTDQPGNTWDNTGVPIVSEMGNVEIQLRLIQGKLL